MVMTKVTAEYIENNGIDQKRKFETEIFLSV